MLQCELLKDLSLQDLQQRYTETWIDYNDSMFFVRGVIANGRGTDLHLLNHKKEASIVPFDYRLLNTERLPSKWYYTTTKQAVFLSYKTRRQYSRGLNQNNADLYDPARNTSWTTALFHAMREQKTVTHRTYTPAEIAVIQKKELPVILDNFFCLLWKYGLFYRTTHIGVYDHVKNKVALTESDYKQELCDLGYEGLLANPTDSAEIIKNYTPVLRTFKDIRPQAIVVDDFVVNRVHPGLVNPPYRVPDPSIHAWEGIQGAQLTQGLLNWYVMAVEREHNAFWNVDF